MNKATQEREERRNDFSNQFLRDVLNAPNQGHDPRNHIGKGCGVRYARALHIAFERVSNHTLWSDLPGHVNYRQEA